MSSPHAPGQSPELQDVRRAIRRIMADFGPDYWAEEDRERQFPERFFATMAKAGYFGTLIPETHGGTDAGVAVASVIVEEINRAGGDAATINAQMSICVTLVRDGSQALKDRYLSGIAEGRFRLLSVAATEPDSGADMSTLRSAAYRDGDAWVVEAHKVFISMADDTRLLLLLVNTDQGLTLFLLAREDYPEGIAIHPMPMITNRLTTTLFIDGLRVPDAARVGALGKRLAC